MESIYVIITVFCGDIRIYIRSATKKIWSKLKIDHNTNKIESVKSFTDMTYGNSKNIQLKYYMKINLSYFKRAF